jgi:hypothetical protein
MFDDLDPNWKKSWRQYMDAQLKAKVLIKDKNSYLIKGVEPEKPTRRVKPPVMIRQVPLADLKPTIFKPLKAPIPPDTVTQKRARSPSPPGKKGKSGNKNVES